MNKTVKILYLEDQKGIRDQFIKELKELNCSIEPVNNIFELERKWAEGYDIALIDLNVPLGKKKTEMPDAEHTINFLKKVVDHYLVRKTIVYTASKKHSKFDTVRELRKLHVRKVIIKNDANWINQILNEVKEIIRNLIVRKNDQNYVKTKQFVQNYKEGELIYCCGSMQEIMSKIEDNINSNFILTGESGTGKSFIAKRIHEMFKREIRKKNINAKVPYRKILSGELRDDKLSFEQRMYGRKKGSYTGADTSEPGILSEIDGGVLFFDEILDTPKGTQSKMLDLIQNKVYSEVGETLKKNRKKINFKIIAATNKNIAREINERLFRNDLFNRLKDRSVLIEMPPLNERKEDIQYLVDYFIQELNENENKDIKIQMTDIKIIERLKRNDWKDQNIPELKNKLYFAYSNAVNDGRDFIDVKDLETGQDDHINIKDQEYDELLEKIIEYAVKIEKQGIKIKFYKQLNEDLIIKSCRKFSKSTVSKILGASIAHIYGVLRKQKKQNNRSQAKIFM